jgi:hypothetical protein
VSRSRTKPPLRRRVFGRYPRPVLAGGALGLCYAGLTAALAVFEGLNPNVVLLGGVLAGLAAGITATPAVWEGAETGARAGTVAGAAAAVGFVLLNLGLLYYVSGRVHVQLSATLGLAASLAVGPAYALGGLFGGGLGAWVRGKTIESRVEAAQKEADGGSRESLTGRGKS